MNATDFEDISTNPPIQLGRDTRKFTGFSVVFNAPGPRPHSLDHLAARKPDKTSDSVVAELEQAAVNREEQLEHHTRFARRELAKVGRIHGHRPVHADDERRPLNPYMTWCTWVTYNPFLEAERIHNVPRPARMEAYLRAPMKRAGLRERLRTDMRRHRERHEAHLAHRIRVAMKEESRGIQCKIRKLELQREKVDAVIDRTEDIEAAGLAMA